MSCCVPWVTLLVPRQHGSEEQSCNTQGSRCTRVHGCQTLLQAEPSQRHPKENTLQGQHPTHDCTTGMRELRGLSGIQNSNAQQRRQQHRGKQCLITRRHGDEQCLNTNQPKGSVVAGWAWACSDMKLQTACSHSHILLNTPDL